MGFHVQTSYISVSTSNSRYKLIFKALCCIVWWIPTEELKEEGDQGLSMEGEKKHIFNDSIWSIIVYQSQRKPHPLSSLLRPMPLKDIYRWKREKARIGKIVTLFLPTPHQINVEPWVIENKVPFLGFNCATTLPFLEIQMSDKFPYYSNKCGITRSGGKKKLKAKLSQ